MTEPTPAEIAWGRNLMRSVDDALRRSHRVPSDEEVRRYITDPIGDCGGTLLGQHRAFGVILRAYKGRRK